MIRCLVLTAVLAGCSAAPEREPPTTGFVRDVSMSGTIVDASAYLLRGATGAGSGAEGAPGAKALLAVDGVYLLLPPGPGSSDAPQEAEDPAVVELLRRQISSLEVGDRVRVVGELYRRGGLQGIEPEKLVRP